MIPSYFKIGILDMTSEEMVNTSEIDMNFDITPPEISTQDFVLKNQSTITLQTQNFD